MLPLPTPADGQGGHAHVLQETVVSGAARSLKASSVEFAQLYKHGAQSEAVRKPLKRCSLVGLLGTPAHRSPAAGKTLSAWRARRTTPLPR